MKIKNTNNLGRFPKSLKVAGMIGALALANSAQAGVIWLFEETGTGGSLLTTATAYGSFSIDVVSDGTNYYTEGVGGNSADLSTLGGSLRLLTGAGSSTATTLATPPTSGTGTFAASYTRLVWDPAHGNTLLAGTDIGSANGVVTPSVTWAAGNTIADIFGGTAPTTNITAWTLSGGAASDTVQYAFSSVPEPSSSSLLIFGGLALLTRRNRN